MDVALDSVAAIVDDKNNRLQPMAHHGRQFLHSQLPMAT